MTKRVVIIGGVATGMKTAARLRRRDKDVEIIVLERGMELSYGACGFPYYISGEVPDFDSFDHTPQGSPRNREFFRKVKGIDARVGCNVIAIDRRKKEVTYVEDGMEKKLAYDTLVLGTGASPVKLHLPNACAKGIHSFWFPWDARAVEEEIRKGGVRDVVIIGAGFIGMELAEAFVKRGLNTSIVEMQEGLLPQLLDQDMGELLLRELRGYGLNIRLGEKTVAFEERDGHVTGVVTDKGVVPAQLVIIAVGVRPNVELAKAAGLPIGPTGCIAVNEYLQTGDPDIYAGGDCAENVHRVSGAKIFAPMGSTANKHGRIIADNICGDGVKYQGVLGTGICRIFDVQAGSTGLNERSAAAAGINFKTVIVPGFDRLGYMPGAKRIIVKLLAEEGTERVLGVQAVGSNVDKRIDTMVAALSMGATLEDVAQFDISYAPPFNGPIDNLSTAANVLRNKMAGQMKQISAAEFAALRSDGKYLFVDVRTPREFSANRIAGIADKINLPLDRVRAEGGALCPKDMPVITSCQIDLRGYEAEVMLRGMGYEDVSSLEGGMSGWPYATESDA